MSEATRRIAMVGLLLAGCVPVGGGGSGDGGASAGDGGVARDSDAPDVPVAPPGAPQILSFSSDAVRLTEGQSLQLTAVVTDEDGADDVLGGVLEDPMGGAYGPFTATGAGTYQVEVDWAALHRVVPIEFVGEPERVLWARFFDQAGLESVAALRITLSCPGGGACAGACQDVQADPQNCGGCGVVCPAAGEAALCVEGQCTGACPDGWDLCGDRCVDPGADPAHCGGCGQACPAVQGGEAVCDGSTCGGRCPAAGLACDGACVDPATDVQHCGRCGEVCPGGPGQARCVEGECLAACAADEAVCGGDCVDLDRDPAHCGRCDRQCEAPEGGRPECAGGECVDGCPGGELACGGVCVDPDRDPAHCGRCGNRCPDGETCAGGDCALVCAAGEQACGGVCAECPQGPGVTAVGCDGQACVATGCADGLTLLDGACVARVSEQVGEWTIRAPQAGGYPTIHLDLTVDPQGRPYLIVGRVADDDRVVVAAGAREAGEWRLSPVNVNDRGRRAIRVGAAPLADGWMVLGWAYDRVDRSEVIGGGMELRGVGSQIDRLPGNTGGNLWGFSVAARTVGGQARAQLGISLDNPVNRSMSRYDWQGGDLSLVNPFIDGIVHFDLDAQGEPHFAYQPDYGGAVSWRAGNRREAVGPSAELIGGIKVGPRGPVVAFAQSPDTTLHVATRAAGRWTVEQVERAVQGQFWGFDLALDAAGFPMLCYWRRGTIHVARRTDAGWALTRIAAVDGGQTECAIAEDAGGGVAVAWAHFITDRGVTRATVHCDGLAP